MEGQAIEQIEYDYYNNQLGSKIPQGIFFYFLDEAFTSVNAINYKNVNTVPITHSNCIFNIAFTPFLQRKHLVLNEIKYDINRFQYQEDGSRIGLPTGIEPKVLRIKDIYGSQQGYLSYTETIKSDIKKYKTKSRTQKRSWVNESRLFMYPYTRTYIVDGFNQPIEISPHLVKNNSSVFELKVRGDITSNAHFTYYITDYKNDKYGCVHGFDNSGNMDLPSYTNSYINMMSSNKNFMKQSEMNTIVGGLSTAFAGGVTGFMFGGGAGALVGAGVGLTGALSNSYQTINSNLANEKDSHGLANVMNAQNGDVATALGRTAYKMKIYRTRLNDAYMQKVGDYFAMYGYKINAIKNIDLRSRYYYNYIKTSNCNLKTRGIPHNHLLELKNIFNNGVTIWHVDRNGVSVNNYDNDNREV